MALEQHKTAFEFETMLRRHLSRGGSMVEACAGFDADSANAYLENFLGQVARARYESHLAGCPSCRRHIIELSRFLQLPEIVSQPAIQPAPITKPESIWSKWKTAASGWFDLSAWNRGWATASAAAAILLAVTATQLWRQSQPMSLANLAQSAPPASNRESNAQAQPSLTPDALLVNNFTPEQATTTPRVAAVPTPDVSPVHGNSALASQLNAPLKNTDFNTELTRIGSINPSLPVPATGGGRVMTTGFAPNLTSGQPALMLETSTAPPAPVATDSIAVAEPAKIIAPLNPSPNDNPMTRARKPGPTPTPKSLGTFSFLPSGKAEAERKAELKEIEAGAPKLLTIRVRDKIFSFQSGMWVDHAYKPEMAWRVTKLVRDSEEYQQTLVAEPQLKEFFERSSVIVIWKDKIYKVVPK